MTNTYRDPEADTVAEAGGASEGCCAVARPLRGRGQGNARLAGGRCCAAPSGQVRSFLQARLLLLLMERLAQEGDIPVDPGLLYRTLRLLEDEGAVRSSWETEGAGPARRLYLATPEGVDYLHSWAASIRGLRARLDKFMTAYEGRFRDSRS